MPEFHRTYRLILPEPNGPAALQAILDKVNAKRVREEVGPPHFGVTRDTHWQLAPELWVNHLEDELARAHAYVITGADPARVARFTDLFERALHPVPYQVLLDATSASDDEERAVAISRVGLSAPYDFNEPIFATITKAFKDPSVKVRNAAIRATAYSPWSEFRGALRRHAEVEVDPELRDLARWMASVRLDQYGQPIKESE
jgi:hypothetical protein